MVKIQIKNAYQKFLIFLVIFTLGLGVGSHFFNKSPKQISQTEKNTPKAFVLEAFDKIKENYWDNISDTQLKELFKQATQINGGEVNKETAPKIVQTVLSSLNPPNRSMLYTTQQEVQLKNIVENRNPQTGKVEPTIFSKIITPGILHVQFKKFAPTSLDEFVKTFENAKTDPVLVSLILDLRGNIGGAIDSTSYFLGLFLGKNQSAFDFYHKGEYQPFKTPTDKLPSITKYKQVVVLVDNNTQSSAEMMATSFKRHHLGVVVGIPTKGWGTVEKVFQLDNQFDKENKYSLFLVHSITLRDDNLPIEGQGVEPDINIKSNDWQQQLFSYYRNSELNKAVSNIISSPY